MYGFVQDSLIGQERDTEYAVQVGYWKGAESAGLDFALDVRSTDGTAGMLIGRHCVTRS